MENFESVKLLCKLTTKSELVEYNVITLHTTLLSLYFHLPFSNRFTKQAY